MRLHGETSLGHGGPQSPNPLPARVLPAAKAPPPTPRNPGVTPAARVAQPQALPVTRAVWPKGTKCGCAAGNSPGGTAG